MTFPKFSGCSELLFIISSYFFQPPLISAVLHFLWLSSTTVAAFPELNIIQVRIIIFVLSQVPLLNFLAV